MNNLTEALSGLKESSTSTSTSASFETIIDSLSPVVKGRFGEFREVIISGKRFNIDARKVTNPLFYTPKCNASVTFQTGKRRDGSEGTFINNIVFALPSGAISSQH